MTKITEEDLALWNLYKLNYKLVSKKVDSFYSKNFDQEKKLMNFSKQKFFLEKRIVKSLEKNQIKFDQTLDLHGSTQSEAKIKVKEFLLNSFKNKKRNLVIITGKGHDNKGILKIKTPEWLESKENSSLIVGFCIMPKTLGGDGAIFVRVKNKNKYLENL